MIGRLRKALSAAFGRTPAGEVGRHEDGHATEAGRRIEAARRRLKKTIPPPED